MQKTEENESLEFPGAQKKKGGRGKMNRNSTKPESLEFPGAKKKQGGRVKMNRNSTKPESLEFLWLQEPRFSEIA